MITKEQREHNKQNLIRLHFKQRDKVQKYSNIFNLINKKIRQTTVKNTDPQSSNCNTIKKIHSV